MPCSFLCFLPATEESLIGSLSLTHLAVIIIQIPTEFLIFKSPGLTAREIDFNFCVYGV